MWQTRSYRESIQTLSMKMSSSTVDDVSWWGAEPPLDEHWRSWCDDKHGRGGWPANNRAHCRGDWRGFSLTKPLNARDHIVRDTALGELNDAIRAEVKTPAARFHGPQDQLVADPRGGQLDHIVVVHRRWRCGRGVTIDRIRRLCFMNVRVAAWRTATSHRQHKHCCKSKHLGGNGHGRLRLTQSRRVSQIRVWAK